MHLPDSINTLIVDDDQIARTSLRHILVRYFRNIHILGEADSVAEAIKLIDEKEPDLLFLDINLPDGTGFDIIESSVFRSYQVIFTTAYDQYAVKAFEFSALHYLLKPIKKPHLEEALKRYRPQSIDPLIHKKLDIFQATASGRPPEKMLISSKDGLQMVKINDIVRCEAAEAYTLIYMNDNKRYTVSKSLSIFENILEGRHFSRVHNKHLVNLKYIKQYHRGKGGTVIMEDGTEVEVSVRKKNIFMDELKLYALST